MSEAIAALLRPRRLAVVGASPREGSFGANLLRSIRQMGFEGEVSLVNPRYDRIDGQTCYGSLSAVPDGVDCAAFAVADSHLVGAVSAAAQAGVRGAVLFGRAHGQEADGRQRAQVVREIAGSANMAICSANCMGFVNLADRLQLTGMPFKTLPAPSGVALISHSGSTWSGLAGNGRHMGFDYAISAGQELVTTVADYIRFLVERTDIRVIACVLETIRDPQGFIAAARMAGAKGVAIVALKLGRSETAKQFALSHSGALSGSNAAYDAIFAQYGIVQVCGLDELLDTVELLALRRTMPAPGIALGTDSGGERQLIVDLAADQNVTFADLAPETLAAIEAHLDPGMEASNPLDYWGDGANVMAPVLGEMAKDPGVGIVVMATNLLCDRNFSEMSAAAIRAVHAATDKPVALMGNIATTMSPTIAADLRSRGIGVLMGTASSLAALKHLRQHRFGRQASEPTAPLPLSPVAREILDGAQRDALRSAEGFRLLREAGIPVAAFADIGVPEEIPSFAAAHGWPIVLKIDSAAIPHKSDQGGVFVGLETETEAFAAWEALRRRHPETPIIAQAMATGVELILGMTTDPDFGPLVTVGLGGVFAEIFQDTTALLPPFGPEAARFALQGLKSWPLLTGARGRAPVDLDALCDLISRFSAFAAGASGRIAEIEINPVLAGPDGAIAVDCLALRRKEQPRHDH